MAYEILTDVKLPDKKSSVPTMYKASHINRQKAKKEGSQFYIGNPCRKCKTTKRYAHSKKCFECSTHLNELKKKEPEKYAEVKKKWWLKNTYGLTLDQYNEILKSQNYQCALCGLELKVDKQTHIDHCHETNKIRGILCNHCNLGIGHLRHDPALIRKAALYCEQV